MCHCVTPSQKTAGAPSRKGPRLSKAAHSVPGAAGRGYLRPARLRRPHDALGLAARGLALLASAGLALARARASNSAWVRIRRSLRPSMRSCVLSEAHGRGRLLGRCAERVAERPRRESATDRGCRRSNNRAPPLITLSMRPASSSSNSFDCPTPIICVATGSRTLKCGSRSCCLRRSKTPRSAAGLNLSGWSRRRISPPTAAAKLFRISGEQWRKPRARRSQRRRECSQDHEG